MPSIGASLLAWLAQNLEAAIGLATLLAMGAGFLVSQYLKRKRLSYRVHLDTQLGDTPDHLVWLIDVVIKNRGTTVVDPSFALVRIMNTGSTAIKIDDFQRDELRLRFGGRHVLDAQVVEGERLEKALPEGWPRPDKELALPIVPLNRRDKIKILVLLSGKPEPDQPAVSLVGFLSGGKILRDNTRGDGPGRRSMVLGGIALTLVGASLVAVVFPLLGDGPSATTCTSGAVTMNGSTAFAPVATEIMRTYTERCRSATVTVEAQGSLDGIRELDRVGRDDAAERERRIVMSDGRVPQGYPNLVSTPIGVVVFAVAVNEATGVYALTTDQLRGIYDGRLTNWNQVGGADLPISVVSRGAGSGTRLAFENNVLGRSEPAPTSDDCIARRDRDRASAVTKCEYGSTNAQLDQVDQIPGAIGYAETSAIARYTSVTGVKLDGREPHIDSVIRAGYPFWAVEYFATYGPPQANGLGGRLLEYMASDTAKNILRRSGYVPCLDGSIDLRDSLCR